MTQDNGGAGISADPGLDTPYGCRPSRWAPPPVVLVAGLRLLGKRRLNLARKTYTTRQDLGLLRKAQVELAQDHAAVPACKKLAVTPNTYYRWRRHCGGLKVDQAKRLKDLERENARPKRLLVDAHLDAAFLREAAEGNMRDLSVAGRRWGTSARRWGASERRVCRVLGEARPNRRHKETSNGLEEPVRQRLGAIVGLSARRSTRCSRGEDSFVEPEAGCRQAGSGHSFVITARCTHARSVIPS